MITNLKTLSTISIVIASLFAFFAFYSHDPSMAQVLKTRTSDLPRLFKAPEFRGLSNWINSDPIRSMNDLKGKVVLVDFWTFGCVNCIHTLPYVKEWHNRYADRGLVVLGVHAPEFQYERKLENVQAAVKRFQIKYPVVQDNDFKFWRAYKNRYWPALFLVDADGIVRYTHYGEGRYRETEGAIVKLLKDIRS